jgi:hypothetical protein
MQRPQPTFCPLIQGTCKQFDCLFWTQLRGTHPQTGQEIDEYDCAVRWLPILLIENAKEVRQGAAAVESLRNRVVAARVTAQTDFTAPELLCTPVDAGGFHAD